MNIHMVRVMLYCNMMLVVCHIHKKNDFCRYKKKLRFASCYNLTFSPNFVRNLELHNNKLPHIRRSSFYNISANNLTRLMFKDNKILTLDSDSFADLRYLRNLIISEEKELNITTIKSSLQSVIRLNFQSLQLDNNGWTAMPSDMFTHFTGANLELLTLDYIRLRTLDTAVFTPLNKVKRLSCKGNFISGITSNSLLAIEELDLSDNNINAIPNFCGKAVPSLVPKLKTISFAYNAIKYITPGSFECLNNVQHLTLDGNPIKTLNNNIFSNLNELRRLFISYITQIKFISPFAFNSTSLTSLQFVQNSFRFDRRDYSYDVNNIFKFLPNLQEINLGNNYLPRKDNALFRMFMNLKNLRKLTLSTSFISEIPELLLQQMPHLETLNLHGNNIHQLNESMFEKNKKLRNLYLDGNQLHIINKTTFPERLLKSLKVLHLSNNPFWCTCDQKWFLDMIRSSNMTDKLKNWPQRYACYYPENLRFTLMVCYFPTEAECSPFKLASVIIIVTTSSVLVIIVFVMVTFGCQVNIKNGLYLLRVYHRMKRGLLRPNLSLDFEFDAFIVYCDEDRQWVNNILLPKLESSDFKICVHYRDFDIGEPIINNIERYIDKSWKIIAVMSNNFARSEWCQWEIDFIQERRRAQGKDSLVLIMYQQIDSYHMTSPIRILLNTAPYITYKEGFGENLFWKAVMSGVRKPTFLRPTAML